MRLSDIMGNADLSFYPIVALVLFGFAFALILVSVFSKHNRLAFEEARQIPLVDDSATDKVGTESFPGPQAEGGAS